VVVQLRTLQGLCTIFNIYNDCTHDDTIFTLERFLPGHLPSLRPTEQDHLVWLGDFNRHHPLWDEERNSHLFTGAALEASQKLIDILADYGLMQILPKDILTLQSTNSGNWTRLDNIFCTDHTCGTLITCDTDPGRRGPNTDHVLVLTQFDMSLVASADSPSWNYHEVDWEKFNSTINEALSNINPPSPLDMVESFQAAARSLDAALCSTVEEVVPKTRPHPHQKQWWTKDLTKRVDELKHLRKQVYRFRAIPDHISHTRLKEKEKQLDKEIHTTKETHWKDWLEEMAGNDIWIASKYITNPGGDGGKSRIPTLKSQSADGSETLAATNEEKGALLANTLFPPP